MSLSGPVEIFIAFLALFIIFVIIKHLIFHTFYYYFQRTGRSTVTQLLNKFQGQSLTKRIITSHKNDNFSSSGEVHQLIKNFSEKRYFERVPSLFDDRKSKCFESHISSETQKIILFLDDNGGEELWRTLKLVDKQVQHEIFVVIDHLEKRREIKEILQGIIKGLNLPKTIKISFVDAKPRLALSGKFDLVYTWLKNNYRVISSFELSRKMSLKF